MLRKREDSIYNNLRQQHSYTIQKEVIHKRLGLLIG